MNIIKIQKTNNIAYLLLLIPFLNVIYASMDDENDHHSFFCKIIWGNIK